MGVIFFPVDGFLFDAVCVSLGSALQTALMDDLHAAHVLVFLGPEVHPRVEVFRPAVGKGQDGFDAIKNADFLRVRGGYCESVTARRKGCTGDGKLAAGGPDCQLRGILIFVLGQTADPPHIACVKFLKLCQRAVGVAVGKGSHCLGFTVILLDGQGLGGGHPFQSMIDAVGGAGQSIVAGVLPVTAADGAAAGLGEVLAVSGLLDGDGAAVVEGCGVCRERHYAEHRHHDKQHRQQAGKTLVFHGKCSFRIH